MHDISVKKLFFDETAPRWVRDAEQRSAHIARILAKHDLPLTAPLLDVGSGAGILLPFILANNDDSALITEFDISREMMQHARALHGARSGVHYIQGDAHHLPFRDASYETVMCFSVYPHFQNPVAALTEIRRCLIPGGRLCIFHLMGHRELNDMHRAAGKAVQGDVIPPADALSLLLAKNDFTPYVVRELSDLYLIIARRS
ncbi:MAG: class I SAM-dependent methyltransferase [Bacteroidia bacterium]|nr:class I SAM-dependent methyltransferase [Bacteroidia bacterium]